MPLKAGDEAPDFTLKSFTPTEEVKDISLKNFKGKNVILLFYPMSFTGVCTDEMCTISENYSKYSELEAEVLGISTDGTFVQKAFAKQNNIPFPLLSDYNKEVIKLYDVVQEEFAHGMKCTSQRAVYIIDKEGIIRYAEVTENPGVNINFEKMKDALQSINYSHAEG